MTNKRLRFLSAVSILTTILLNAPIASATSPTASNHNKDPFIGKWVDFDGVHTYHLTVSKSHAPGQKYSIRYKTAHFEYASDMCNATSNTTLECANGAYGAKLVLDDTHHSITAITADGMFVFYNPNHAPAAHALLGIWKAKHSDKYADSDFTIIITKGKSDTEVMVSSNSSSTNGGLCQSSGFASAYKVTTDADNMQFVTNSSGVGFQHDPEQHRIIKGKNRRLHAGMCIDLEYEFADVIFTKS